MIKDVPNTLNVRHVIAPASKSYAQRAILAAALSRGTSLIKNVGTSDDVQNIMQIAIQLGANVIAKGDDVSITGLVREPRRKLNCGESGLGIRLTTSIASTFGGDFEISGKGSLLYRPMDDFNSFLPKLGIDFESNNGLVPLKISGDLSGGRAAMDGSMSSQFLSGILMALPLAKSDSQLEVSSLKSIPYVEMTLDLLKAFGIEVEHTTYSEFVVPGNQVYQAIDYNVEGDWSGAAFWAVYGAISGEVSIYGLNEASHQADRKILDALTNAQVKFKWRGDDLQVFKSNIQPFEFDANHCPDLFPILVVLAAAAKGESKILGIQRLKFKESDRATVLQQEFKKLGLSIDLENDTMTIHGTGNLNSGTISSNNDHRIAMSAAIASLLTPEGIKINHAEAVNKSYPEFWEVLKC